MHQGEITIEEVQIGAEVDEYQGSYASKNRMIEKEISTRIDSAAAFKVLDQIWRPAAY